jgi:undecaprenyl-diphosphatase
MDALAPEPVRTAHDPARPVWRLGWLTPARSRLILAAVLLAGFLGHLRYLTHDCPIDLAPDEAQYWDWSRQLDLSYYSKGPLVAYIIRASCAVFGDTMWAVRLPALALAVGTGLVTYALTRRLFGSERLALGAVLLNALVPMFIAGSVLMTIDPPFYFCWALATYLAARAILDGRRWCWPLVGVVVGVGFLAKYATLLWLPSLFLALVLDRASRPVLRTAGPWVATVVALLLTTPVVVWNARHDWVSLRHVATQTGTDGANRFEPLSVPEFLGGQAGVLGPPIAVLMVAAVVYALSRRSATDPRRREMRLLVWIGLPFFVGTTLLSLLTKVQANWPAPAYFSLLILTAYFLATRLNDAARWKPWRPWFYAAVVLGAVATPVLHHTEIVYPLIRWQHAARGAGGEPSARQVDVTARLKGWGELGARVTEELGQLGPDAFVLCEDYQATAEMAFYVAGQPKTYCAGSYFTGPRRKRHTQWDVWPDRSLDPARRPEMLGRDAVYVGFLNDDVRNAFERVAGPYHVEVMRGGLKVRTFRYARCFGFKGMSPPGGAGGY